MSKLFLITRRDLSPAQQAVQAAHAQRQFAHEHPQIEREWFETSNTLAFLCVPDEEALGVLHQKAVDRDVPVAAFREPDRSDELTAIAIGPTGKRLTKGLPLALHEHPQKEQPDQHDRRRTLPLDGESADV
jgi:peptidyl-tRNA hydrolase